MVRLSISKPLIRSSVIGLLAFGLLLLLLCTSWSRAGRITVDLGVEQGAMNHRANGYLIGIEPNDPPLDLILPLKPTSFRGNAGYILRNYDRLRQAGVTEFQLTLGLVFHHLALQIFNINQIGLDGNYAPWLAHVDHVVDQVIQRRLSVLWDIYNELDLASIPIAENELLKEGRRLAYQRIKQRIPDAVIVRPSVSGYRLLKPFLEWSQAHEGFPDVVAYHEYGDPFGAITYVDDLRALAVSRARSRSTKFRGKNPGPTRAIRAR